MNSEIQNKHAIDFLDLVREDLEKIGSSDTPQSAVVTARYSNSELNTVSLDSDEAPSRLGRFKILEQIGEGGFARVFVANDPNLDRAVALKVPKPHVLISPEARSRFEREAKSAAILSHPNIVPVFEIGSAGPIHFIASEYCPGPNLRTWYAKSQVKTEPRTAVRIVSQLADALQHAHRRGIVHRDLKPSNVLVVTGEEDIASRLRITDFGLAKHVASEDTLTASGSIIGTPAYMSPEQAEGIGKVDHRTDVYSLGMVLYEMLTGRAPFKRSSHIASIAAVINESVPPPGEINRKVNADLEAVCLKALEKNPDTRYQSAHDFKRDLLRWLEGRTVSVRELSQPVRMGRWVKRNLWLSSAILFGVLCLSIGFAFSFFQWKQAQANLVQSLQQRDRAEKNVDELHATIINALDISLDSLEKQVQLIPAHQKVLDELMNAHMRLIEEEAEQVEITPLTFECYERLSTIYRCTGRYDKSLEIVQRAENMLGNCVVSHEGLDSFALVAADICLEKAALFSDMGDDAKQIKFLEEAKQLFLKAEHRGDRVLWLEEGFYIYRYLAFYASDKRDYGMARKYFERSGAMAVEALKLKPDDEQLQFNYAKSFVDISHSFHNGREWATALECLERSEELFIAAMANPDSKLDSRDYRYRLAYIRHEMTALLRYRVKDYERAEECSRWVIKTLQELVDENPGYLVYHNRLSHAYLRLMQVHYDQDMFDEVLDLIPVAEVAHLQGRSRWVPQRIASGQRMAAMIHAYEYDDPVNALRAFDKAIDAVENFEGFGLDRKHLVNSLLDSYREKCKYYGYLGNKDKAIDCAGKGHRLAVQRAFKFPNVHNIDLAIEHAKDYAERLSDDGQYGLAKSAFDSVADAGKESIKAQFEIACAWGKLDFRQREAGADREVWEVSQNKAMYHLTRAIDLGFSDHKRLRQRSFLRKYKHVPAFEANCERIKPAASSSK